MQTKRDKPKQGRRKRKKNPKSRKIRVYNYVHKKSRFKEVICQKQGLYRQRVGGVGVCVCVCVCVCVYTQLIQINSPQNGCVEHHHQSATCHRVKFPMETSEGRALGKLQGLPKSGGVPPGFRGNLF
ncbi:unnamed protein product [Pipistrellus nathusii]|uniref:40S ribosomal protein S30 n=1 Tax=Pipistrellus nathusii TaxID=59473 RepID=A0ABP0A7E2_PIPNA